MLEAVLDENELYRIRKQKLTDLRTEGFTFPNDFRPQNAAQSLLDQYGHLNKEECAAAAIEVSLAGRMVLRRIMGKASFFHLQDASGRLQIYVRENEFHELYDAFKHWDLGDIVGVTGTLFITQTGELTLHANTLRLLTKSLRPLPDKFHGLADQEICYRKRYVDLIANPATRKTFLLRSKLLSTLRIFMEQHDFLEVETPMMHPIPGGAMARPFTTHHHALDMPMYLRVAPELYLKRLVVGGFERVYEINRNFRNEGLSTRHNPEFTMVEFYQAYSDYKDLMRFTEELLHFLCDNLLDSRQVVYQEYILDFDAPFTRLSVTDAILVYHPELTADDLSTVESMHAVLDKLKLPYKPSHGLGQLHMIVFEENVEHRLIQPTFITGYPTEVSPLARRSDDDANLTDRFEFFIAGREIANGFSELNDAEDQAARFQKQVDDKNAGDLEAMHFDHDYIEALEYGMPPTAGEGIGIDRLVMLFTNSPAIRDVILFPHLAPRSR